MADAPVRTTTAAARRGHRLLAACSATALATVASLAVSSVPASAGGAVPHASLGISLVWQQTLPDGGAPIGQSSPSEATLDGGGPSVVVGDRAGNVWAFHLSNGSGVAGWPAHTGAPIDSTPSVTPDGGGTDDVFVGAGNAASPNVGGYYAFNHAGAQIWGRNATDPNGNHGVQASMSVGSIDGVTAVVAPSLGQDQYAFNAANGAVLPGWPFFTADSSFSTPFARRPVRERPDRRDRGWGLDRGDRVRSDLQQRRTCPGARSRRQLDL